MSRNKIKGRTLKSTLAYEENKDGETKGEAQRRKRHSRGQQRDNGTQSEATLERKNNRIN